MDRVTLLSATIYTLFGLASVSTVGRVLSRWRRLAGEGFKWDDWTSFLSHVCAVGLTVAEYYQLANGLGQQSYLLDSQSLERFLLVSDGLWRSFSSTNNIAVEVHISTLLYCGGVWHENKSCSSVPTSVAGEI